MTKIKHAYKLPLTLRERNQLVDHAHRQYEKLRNELEENDHPVLRYELGRLMMQHAQAQLNQDQDEDSYHEGARTH